MVYKQRHFICCFSTIEHNDWNDERNIKLKLLKVIDKIVLKIKFGIFISTLLSGVYLTAVMAITCVSVIMTVIVLNFFYRGPTLTHVPAWAQM